MIAEYNIIVSNEMRHFIKYISERMYAVNGVLYEPGIHINVYHITIQNENVL